jgi:hypothetical protein
MVATGGDVETVRLLKFESVQLRTPTTTMMTFYEGRPPLDYIKDRVTEICDKNPWLQGRLSKEKGRLFLEYPKNAREIGPYLRVVSLPALSHDMSFTNLNQALKGMVVKRGFLCVDKDEVLFRVVVAEIAEDRFAVVVALSHVYADGYTFYEVHKMLSMTESARPLIVGRVYSSRADINTAMRGGEDALSWLGSPGFAVNAAGSLLRRRPPVVNLFRVDQRKVDERKREYEAKNEGKFISSNDIVTSDFFSMTDCDLMFMTVNFRNRIPHLTQYHAGNYQGLIAYQREDFATPDLIRSAMSDYRRAISGKLPGFFRSTRVKLGAITNLATPYQDVELPGCRLSFHRPVVDAAPFFPFEHTVYIVKSHDRQLCLVTCSKDTAVLPKVDILEEKIV